MMIVRECRQAWRRLVKRPGYAVLSIAVLGVGLGVTLFLFSLVNTMILSPLPFPQADRLVAVGETHANGIGVGDVDVDQYVDLRQDLDGVEARGAYLAIGGGIDTGAGATMYDGTVLSASMLPMLGAKPLLGRVFTAADDKLGAPRVMLIGENLWRHVFHASPKVIGRKVRVSGHWTTIVGVLPKRFGFRGNSQFWLPLRVDAGKWNSLNMVARLKPGVTLTRARAELAALDAHLHHASPEWRHEEHLVMKPLAHAMMHKDIRRWVWLMFGAGALVLLLACVNVGNLQLVQTLNRRRELALRSALGSSRSRLFVGALMESLLLSAAALVIALPIVYLGNHWLVGMMVANGKMPSHWEQFGIHGWVWVAAAGMALLSTAFAGLVSAWRAARADLRDALRDGGKGSGGGFAHVAKTLVVVEVALTVVLLVGAGMFVQSLGNVLNQSPVGATHATHVLTARVALPSESYTSDTQRAHFFDTAVQRLRATPGVVDATASNTIPSAMLGSHEDVSRPGRPEPLHGWPRVQMGIVGPHFLNTYGVRLIKGRFFDARDQAGSQRVVVIDTRMAHALWPKGDALNQPLTMYPDKPYALTVTVIGVIENMQLDSQLEKVLPGLLMPLAQAAGQRPFESVGLAVRTRTNAVNFVPTLNKVVHAIEPQAAVFAVHTQTRVIAMGRIYLTLLTDVFTALGLVALLLAAAGLYGVLAFAVAQRTREIGIRRSIGAGNGAIMRTVGRTLAWQLGLGLVIGLALAMPGSDMLADPGLGTRAHDPMVFVPVLLLVVGVSLIAALVPLIRALRVSPGEALRYE